MRTPVTGVGRVGIFGDLQERLNNVSVVDTELGRDRDDVKHPDTDGLLLRTGHHQVPAGGQHRQHTATERTSHGHVTALKSGHCSSATIRRHMLEAVQRHTQVPQHLEELVVRHIADRGVNLLAGQRLSRVVRRHPVIGMGHTVVSIRVTHRHANNLQFGPRCHEVRERRQALRIGDVNVAGLHGQRHVAPGTERQPIHRHAQGIVIGLFDLGYLVGRRPLQEIGHVQLRQRLGRSRRSSRRRGSSRRCRSSIPVVVAATGRGDHRQGQQQSQHPCQTLHVEFPLICRFPSDPDGVPRSICIGRRFSN